ncbi:MAG: hypothetical protein R3Y05_03720 [bacterium]
MKCYKVVAKCGHVGRRNYIPIAFAVKANSGKEAAKKVKGYSRVKKHLKDNIISVNEICVEDFNILIDLNNNDNYLHSENKQQQDLEENFYERVVKFVSQEITKKEYKEKRKLRLIYQSKKGSYLFGRGERRYGYCY